MEYDHDPVYLSTSPFAIIVMVVLATIGLTIGVWAGIFLF